MHAVQVTRLDICYAVGLLNTNPRPTAAKRVLRYFKKAKGQKLTSPWFVDADWANPTSRISVGGYAFLLSAAISWSSREQSLVALFTKKPSTRGLVETSGITTKNQEPQPHREPSPYTQTTNLGGNCSVDKTLRHPTSTLEIYSTKESSSNQQYHPNASHSSQRKASESKVKIDGTIVKGPGSKVSMSCGMTRKHGAQPGEHHSCLSKPWFHSSALRRRCATTLSLSHCRAARQLDPLCLKR